MPDRLNVKCKWRSTKFLGTSFITECVSSCENPVVLSFYRKQPTICQIKNILVCLDCKYREE